MNNHLDRNRNHNLFYKGYVGEPLLNPFLRDPDLKTSCLIQVIDSRFQIGYVNFNKIRLFEEIKHEVRIVNLFAILIRHSEIKMVSYASKITDNKTFWKKLNEFMKKYFLKDDTMTEYDLKKSTTFLFIQETPRWYQTKYS